MAAYLVAEYRHADETFAALAAGELLRFNDVAAIRPTTSDFQRVDSRWDAYVLPELSLGDANYWSYAYEPDHVIWFSPATADDIDDAARFGARTHLVASTRGIQHHTDAVLAADVIYALTPEVEQHALDIRGGREVVLLPWLSTPTKSKHAKPLQTKTSAIILGLTWDNPRLADDLLEVAEATLQSCHAAITVNTAGFRPKSMRLMADLQRCYPGRLTRSKSRTKLDRYIDFLSHDLAILPGREGGFGSLHAESLAAGTAVATYGTPSAYLVDHDVNGVLTPDTGLPGHDALVDEAVGALNDRAKLGRLVQRTKLRLPQLRRRFVNQWRRPNKRVS